MCGIAGLRPPCRGGVQEPASSTTAATDYSDDQVQAHASDISVDIWAPVWLKMSFLDSPWDCSHMFGSMQAVPTASRARRVRTMTNDTRCTRSNMTHIDSMISSTSRSRYHLCMAAERGNGPGNPDLGYEPGEAGSSEKVVHNVFLAGCAGMSRNSIERAIAQIVGHNGARIHLMRSADHRRGQLKSDDDAQMMLNV